MNQPYRFPYQKMHVYQAAKEFAKAVHLAKIRDPKLRDQATRALKSAFLQLSEGLPNDSVPMRRSTLHAHATASARWSQQSTSPSNSQTPSPSSLFAFALCSSASFVDLLLEVGVTVLVLVDWTLTSSSRSEREKLHVIDIYPSLDALTVRERCCCDTHVANSRPVAFFASNAASLRHLSYSIRQMATRR